MNRKTILRTIWITLSVILILGISVFGILSFCAPATMMDLSSSLGLTGISGDYAYQEYLQSGDIDCLAHAFETAAVSGRDQAASVRFDALYENEGFDAYCREQDEKSYAGAPKLVYRSYVCGLAVEVKYRLSTTDEERSEVSSFALKETKSDFPASNPMYVLANMAAERKDAGFCATLAELLKNSNKFGILRSEASLPEEEQSDGYLRYQKTIEVLEGIES